MLLYHGTCKKHAEAIAANGFDGGFLTALKDLAEYYAEEAAEENGCVPMVIVVDAPEDGFSVDMPAIEEPMAQALSEFGLSEEDFHKVLDEGELMEWPEVGDWRTGMKMSFSVKSGPVPKEQVFSVEEKDVEAPDWMHELVSAFE